MVEDLLTVAEQLSTSGSTRPRQAHLRRAVSTAYYAAFHAFCRLGADTLVGDKEWEDYTAMYRSVDHGAFRRLAAMTALNAAVREAAALIVSLQERWHEADYDPRPLGLKRKATLQVIDSARQIERGLKVLSAPERLQLSVQLVARFNRR